MGRVFHASTSADKSARGGGASGGSGGLAAAGGEVSAAHESHPFSKTKVRGAVTLLKFAQVRALCSSWVVVFHGERSFAPMALAS